MSPKIVAGKKSEMAKNHESHTSPMKTGMGMNYGTGAKNPVGKVRAGTVGINPVSKKKLGKPPKSLA